MVFLAELNGLELWGADVGNAYLEAKTKEKVYIVGGPEFGILAGHTLLIDKAQSIVWLEVIRFMLASKVF